MFDNLLMSMNSKLKKIMSGLETNEGKIDEISTDVGSVGTNVAAVQSTSDEIKALIGTEIATQLSALEANVIAAMPSGSSGLTSCIRKIQRGTLQYTKLNYNEEISATLSGFSDLSKMFVIINAGMVKYSDTATDGAGGAYVASLAKTKLTINSYSNYVGYVSYQVIEFY